MRKVRTFWLFLFILMLSSCEHKEFHYVSSRFYPLRVEFDWNRLTDHEKPEGMRVFFFPKVGTGEPWIFDFPHGEGQQIELPCNDYQAICMNMTPTAFSGRIRTATGSSPPLRGM